MFAPVIEHMRNVHDLARQLGRAQRKIVILREIEFLPEFSDPLDQIAPISGQMTDDT